MAGAQPDLNPSAASAAINKGCEALVAGETSLARAWFERAARLSPDDATAGFLRASAQMETDPIQAMAALRKLCADQPAFVDARVLLLICATRLQEVELARAELDRFLSSNALPPTDPFARLADLIAVRSGASGWMALDHQGRLAVSLCATGRPPPLQITLDGRRLRLPARALVAKEAGHALPQDWRTARLIDGVCDGQRLIGSPIDIQAILRIEGFVGVSPDWGLEGWAWHPAAPDQPAQLQLCVHDPATGETTTRLIAADDDSLVLEPQPGLRRRGFRVPPADLPAFADIHVRGADGRDLAGSPLTIGRELRASRRAAARIAHVYTLRPGERPAAGDDADSWRVLDATLLAPVSRLRRADLATAPKRAPLDIVIPVFRGAGDFAACLASLHGQVPRGGRIVVVDDGSEDAELCAAVDAAAAAGRITLLRHAANQGFPAAVRTGLRHAMAQGPRDVLLLNADTMLPPRAIARILRAGYAAGDTGSVTPMTNDGTIVSYPAPDHPVPAPAGAALQALDAMFAAANRHVTVEIPTAVGFCMLLRHDCLLEVGGFRDDVFAQGYGEENDWCLRAGHLGWRHVAAADVFVAHTGGTSFGALKSHLIARNLTLLNRLHPGYERLIADFRAADPLRPARHAVDLRRFAAGRCAQGSVLLISHDMGGGVARHVAQRAAEIRAVGLRPILLRPGEGGGCRVAVPQEDTEMVFRLPEAFEGLVAALRPERPLHAEMHHFIGYGLDIISLAERLGLPVDLYVHDYAAWCPRVTMLSDGDRYCGEPADLQTCIDCVGRLGSRLQDPIDVAALRRRSAGWIAGARQVVAPSRDTAARFARHFPGAAPRVAAWENDVAAAAKAPRRAPQPTGARLRVLVPGAIGPDKGFAVLRACAADAAARDLPLEFVVAGFTMDDAALLETGRVFVTGRFEEAEAASLVAAQRADLGFVPSVWPETWCYALTLLWQAGLFAAAFDLGAPAERIRATGAGLVLPLGLPPPRVNDLLLAAAGSARPVRSRTN